MPRAPSKQESRPFEVRSSPIAGLGVFATRRIPKGMRLIEYIGERISSDEADTRYDDDAMVEHHTMLFAVDDDTVIDGARFGNDAKYFNHACKPNCEAVNEDGRIFIDTIADVASGTELVYDYALSRDEPWNETFRGRYVCRCGYPGCKGTLLKSPKPPRARAAKAASKTASSRTAPAGKAKGPSPRKAPAKKAAAKKATTKRKSPTQ